MGSTLSLRILEEYGYDRKFVDVLRNSHIRNLYSNQVNCLENGLFRGESFLISTPSGSGKTLISELASIFQVSRYGQKCVFLFPLRALVNEKFHQFKSRYSQFAIKCAKSTGGQEISFPELEKANLIFMTYEKFDACLRSFKHYRWISDISLITIDEIHILEKKIRGARLENLVIRLFKNLKDVQFIFLSATIGNPDNFFQWLKNLHRTHNTSLNEHHFHLIHNSTRPIPLNHYIQVVKNKKDAIQQILQSNLAKKGQILIFTNSRKDTRATCDEILKTMKNFSPKQSESEMLHFIRKHYPDESWENLPQKQYILHGLAYHHAGLEPYEKKAIELFYIHGYIRILAATTTLSAGINTPSKIVILKNIQVFEKKTSSSKGKSQRKSAYYKKVINCNEFHQICGRAGRAGFDERGFAFILVGNVQEKCWLEDHYFSRDPNGKLAPKFQNLASSISLNHEILEEIILLQIYESISMNIFEIQDFVKQTYLFHNFNKNLPLSTIITLEHLDFLSMLKILGEDFSKTALENISGKVVLLDYDAQSNAEFQFQFENQISIPIFKGTSKSNNGNGDDFVIDYLQSLKISLDLHQGVTISNLKNSQIILGEQSKNIGKYPFNHGRKIRFALFLILFGLQNSSPPSQDHHISLVISDRLLDLGYNFETILSPLQDLCFGAIFPSTVMDRLVSYNVIECQPAFNLWNISQFKCTKLGEICIRSFILPKDIKFLYDFHEKSKKSMNVFSFSYFLNYIGPLIEEKTGFKLQYLAEYLELWINEVDLDSIIAKIQVNEGYPIQTTDFLHIIEIIVQLLNASTEIVKYFFPKNDGISLNFLITRIKFGVKADKINDLQNFSYEEILPMRNKLIGEFNKKS
ncbi:MAG: DEAD/DEAH box helicase [Promethearchaeota archaeon]